jgi:2-oxoglutarate ferredoxin oxidoreductase subunit gamma
MRGGTANCSVVVSDQPVASPVVTEPTCAVVMNAPSLDKFAPTVIPGGCLLINSSLVTADPGRDDVKVFKVPANEIANELGNSRVANMVMLGAVAKATGAVPMERVEEALAKKMPARHKHLLDTNLEALRRGAACVE